VVQQRRKQAERLLLVEEQVSWGRPASPSPRFPLLPPHSHIHSHTHTHTYSTSLFPALSTATLLSP
jgi:hypothetical protein